MVNYGKSYIYKICCKDTSINSIYIGSTTNFNRRKSGHKYCCNVEKNENSRGYNLKVYQCIKENGGWDNWSMILIEEYSCENKLQLLRRERHWIENLNADLNKLIPSREKKEYEKIRYETLNPTKKYYEENLEQIKIKRNRKYECECGGKYTHSNKSIHLKSKKHQDYMEQKED